MLHLLYHFLPVQAIDTKFFLRKAPLPFYKFYRVANDHFLNSELNLSNGILVINFIIVTRVVHCIVVTPPAPRTFGIDTKGEITCLAANKEFSLVACAGRQGTL